MCGIAGFVDFTSGAASRDVLASMAYSLRRRGPDARGVWADGPVGLAHARLSIIDLAGSPQPMRATASPVALVYNGELWNYVDMRRELEAAQGVAFDTSGDTEVILRWVDHAWADALPRLDGMFAFAAWHAGRRALLLARDPMGVKPLFYAEPAPGVLVFGSEVKAVLEHPAVGRELDPDALRQVLRFRATYGDETLYRGVRQLNPGCFATFDEQAGLRTGRYFDLIGAVGAARDTVGRMESTTLIEEGARRLTEAVRKRLVADVPVGAFLSGGLDSSLIVATIKSLRAPAEQVRTFSVGFSDDPDSELPFARTAADAVGATHTEVRLAEEDYAALFADMTACRDAPVSEPADLAIARMSEVARQSVKVVLSGEGADEVFGGYPKYGFANPPFALRAALRFTGPRRAAHLAGRLGFSERRALVAARAIAMPGERDRLVQWFSYLERGDLARLLPGLGWSDADWLRTMHAQQEVLDRTPDRDPLRRMQLVDCLTWLPCNLLERGDRMTMAAGLELREPFLDRNLVPFGLALGRRYKVRGGTGKWLVRQWARRRLPPEIVNRRKWGFRVPLAQWFRNRLRPMLFDYLLRRDGLCGQFGDPREVRAMLDAHDQGRVDANLALWTLLSAEVWYQDVFRRQAVAGRGARPAAALAC